MSSRRRRSARDPPPSPKRRLRDARSSDSNDRKHDGEERASARGRVTRRERERANDEDNKFKRSRQREHAPVTRHRHHAPSPEPAVDGSAMQLQESASALAMVPVPSTQSFEPDLPLHAISLTSVKSTVRSPAPAPASPTKSVGLVTSPRADLSPPPVDDSRDTDTNKRPRADIANTSATKRSKLNTLFGNVLDERIDKEQILSMARAEMARPRPASPRGVALSRAQSTSHSPSLSSDRLPQSQSTPTSPLSSVRSTPSLAEQSFLTASTDRLDAYLSAHSRHHALKALPGYHRPRLASPLSPSSAFAASPSAQHATFASQFTLDKSSNIPLVPYHWPLFNNALPAVIANIISTAATISPHIVAMSASLGYDVYQQLCALYAAQLERDGDPHTAVLYLINIDDTRSAVSVYLRHRLFGDAALLAKCRLSGEDPLLRRIYSEWARWSAGEHESATVCDEDERRKLVHQTVACFIAARDIDSALAFLLRCYTVRHTANAAVISDRHQSISDESLYLELAYELACSTQGVAMSTTEILGWYAEWQRSDDQFDRALEAYERDSYWAYMRQLLVVERLAASSLHLSDCRAGQQSPSVSLSQPLTQAVTQAWTTASLSSPALLQSAYESMSSLPSFPFFSSTLSATFRTRATFALHFGLACLSMTQEPRQSLRHLTAAAYELYDNRCVSALVALTSSTLSPRLKELSKENKSLYALALFALLHRALNERHRFHSREMVIWGLFTLDFKGRGKESDEREQSQAITAMADVLLYSDVARYAVQQQHLQRLQQRSATDANIKATEVRLAALATQLPATVSPTALLFPDPRWSCHLLLAYCARLLPSASFDERRAHPLAQPSLSTAVQHLKPFIADNAELFDVDGGGVIDANTANISALYSFTARVTSLFDRSH